MTPHAVARYIERARPGLSYERALAELIDESTRAHRVKEISPGLSLWRGPKPMRLRYRVADPTTPDELPQLVTVLTSFDRRPRC